MVLMLASFPAWITHFVVSVKADAFVLLFAGLFIPPIGVVHGFGVWAGIW